MKVQNLGLCVLVTLLSACANEALPPPSSTATTTSAGSIGSSGSDGDVTNPVGSLPSTPSTPNPAPTTPVTPVTPAPSTPVVSTPAVACPADMTYVSTGTATGFCIDSNTGGGYGSGNVANYYWADQICSDNNPLSPYVTQLDQGKHLCQVSEWTAACNAGIVGASQALWVKTSSTPVPWPYQSGVSTTGTYSGATCGQTETDDDDVDDTYAFRCCK